jgi:hypothetical protein
VFLGKWCLRMYVNKGNLWYKVLVMMGGFDCGHIREGWQLRSTWWIGVGSGQLV